MATTGFGGKTDHFGFATSDLILQESSKVPRAPNEANALDANGDVAKTELYGNAAGTIFDVSATYLLKSGTLDLSTLYVGELSTGVFAGSITVDTTNGDWPKISVSGVLGYAAFQTPAGTTAKAALPAVTLTGGKFAQLIGFTVTAGALNSSSLSVNCDTDEATDGEGEPVAYAASFPNAEVTASGVYTSAAFAWACTAPGIGLIEKQPESTVEPKADWQTSTATGYIPMVRGTAP
jgi:hypothetical protein